MITHSTTAGFKSLIYYILRKTSVFLFQQMTSCTYWCLCHDWFPTQPLAITYSTSAVETFLWCVNSAAVVAIRVNDVLTVSRNHLLSLLFTMPGQGVTDFPVNDMGNSLFAFLTTLSFILKTEFSKRLIAPLEFFKVPVEKVKNSS